MRPEKFYQYIPYIPDITVAGMFSIIVGQKNARRELKFPGMIRKILNIPGKGRGHPVPPKTELHLYSQNRNAPIFQILRSGISPRHLNFGGLRLSRDLHRKGRFSH